MKITFSRLRTKEFATLAQRVIAASKSGKYPVIENHELLKIIEKAYAPYDAVYTKLTYSGKGKAVANADRRREKAFVNLKFFLASYGNFSYMPHAEEAKALYEVFRTFGLYINRMNYANETAQLKKLIEELEKPANKKKLLALNLTPALDELKTAQEHFEILYNEQAKANAALRLLSSATKTRVNLEKALRNYFNLLTAMKTTPNWELIYADTNELVKSLNPHAQAKIKKEEAENEAEEIKDNLK